MQLISTADLDWIESKIDQMFDSVGNYVREQESKIKKYFQFEPLTDTDPQWSNLRTIFYEDYVPSDIFYVPFRRKVSPGWLEWLRFVRRPERMVQSIDTDGIYKNYCLILNDYSPFSSSVQDTQFSPYKLKNHPMLCSPNKKSFSKRKLWAIIQHKKRYLNNTVPEYDGLILKYDHQDDPVLHPLFSISTIYGTEGEFSDDENCPTNSNNFEQIHNYYIPYKLNRLDKKSEINLNIVTSTSEPSTDIEKVKNNMEYSLPAPYRKKDTSKRLPI